MKADFKKPKKIDVLIEFIDPLLGTASANQNIHRGVGVVRQSVATQRLSKARRCRGRA